MTGEKQAGYCSVSTCLFLCWRELEQEFEKGHLQLTSFIKFLLMCKFRVINSDKPSSVVCGVRLESRYKFEFEWSTWSDKSNLLCILQPY